MSIYFSLAVSLTLLIAADSFCFFFFPKQRSGAAGYLDSFLSWLTPFSPFLLSGQRSVHKTDPDQNQGPAAANGGRAEDSRST